MKAIVNGLVLSEHGPVTDVAVVFDRYIRELVPIEELPKGLEQVVDAAGLIVSPGLIDMHIHGCAGHDLMDGKPEALYSISTALAEHGVTAFLPTTMCLSQLMLEKTLQLVRASMLTDMPGALVLGAHLEGPFLNPEYRGAQGAEHIQTPALGWLRPYLDVVRVLTFAPEQSVSPCFQAELSSYAHLVQSIGHSGATYEQALLSIERGVRHAAHLFNGMPPLHHRQPGVVGAVLKADVTVELIADGWHVHPALYDLVRRIKGSDGIILVSDAMRAACLSDGTYELGGSPVQVKGGVARLSDGKLAGSTILLNQAVRNWLQSTQEDASTVVRMASHLPAKVLGLCNKGSIAPGKDADLAVFGPDFQAHMTFVGGKMVYSRS